MAEYTKVFDNPYPNGWENLPSETTPITASALQEHTDAIEHIETYLNENPIKDSTDVSWNQIQTSGSKIAEITIDGQKKDVYAPEGGGISFETGNELSLDNNVLNYKANYGTTTDFEAFKQRTDVPNGATYHVTDDYSGGGGGSIATKDIIVSISSSSGWIQKVPYPDGFNQANTRVVSVMYADANSNDYRTGINIYSAGETNRHIYNCENDGINVFNGDSSYVGKKVRITIMKVGD